MSKTYKQRIYADLNAVVNKYPHAKASDTILALAAMAESICRALPPPKKGRRVITRTKKYRMV